MRRLRIAICFCVITVGCKSSATTGEEAAPDETDMDLLQGVWIAESYERGGKPVSPHLLKKTQIVVEGDTLELIESRKDGELGTFKIDGNQTPKHIDMRIALGPDAGKTVRGIYRLDGDFLRICWAAPGQPRPEAFTTQNGKAVAWLDLLRLRNSD